jgi:hypothetical protein
MGGKHYLVPVQTQGIKKDLEHSITFPMVEDAEDMFVVSKNRLLDVNNWKKSSTHISASFHLTDHHGKPITRRAHKGDHIRIALPAPEARTGDGYDWVEIEAIEYDDYPDEDMETFAMHVRPCRSPLEKRDNDTAHFFSESATSTFVIERRGKRLAALYHGRNETANVGTDMPDAIRNATVAVGAWLGLSDVQWSGLIKGLIEAE